MNLKFIVGASALAAVLSLGLTAQSNMQNLPMVGGAADVSEQEHRSKRHEFEGSHHAGCGCESRRPCRYFGRTWTVYCVRTHQRGV